MNFLQRLGIFCNLVACAKNVDNLILGLGTVVKDSVLAKSKVADVLKQFVCVKGYKALLSRVVCLMNSGP